MNYKDTKPYMSAFLSVDLLTDFEAFCLTDFIDWRYIHSWLVFSTQLVNCCPYGQKELYLCTVAPLLYLLSDLLPPPPFPMYSIYRQLVGSLKMNTTLEYSTRVVQEGDRRCKKSTLNDLAYLTPLRIPLMNPVSV
jgi:hypothetical protein